MSMALPCSASDIGYDPIDLPSDYEAIEEGCRWARKRRRVEQAATSYLKGAPLLISSATLKGPFDSSWKNPYRQQRKTAVFQPLKRPRKEIDDSALPDAFTGTSTVIDLIEDHLLKRSKHYVSLQDKSKQPLSTLGKTNKRIARLSRRQWSDAPSSKSLALPSTSVGARSSPPLPPSHRHLASGSTPTIFLKSATKRFKVSSSAPPTSPTPADRPRNPDLPTLKLASGRSSPPPKPEPTNNVSKHVSDDGDLQQQEADDTSSSSEFDSDSSKNNEDIATAADPAPSRHAAWTSLNKSAFTVDVPSFEFRRSKRVSRKENTSKATIDTAPVEGGVSLRDIEIVTTELDEGVQQDTGSDLDLSSSIPTREEQQPPASRILFNETPEDAETPKPKPTTSSSQTRESTGLNVTPVSLHSRDEISNLPRSENELSKASSQASTPVVRRLFQGTINSSHNKTLAPSSSLPSPPLEDSAQTDGSTTLEAEPPSEPIPVMPSSPPVEKSELQFPRYSLSFQDELMQGSAHIHKDTFSAEDAASTPTNRPELTGQAFKQRTTQSQETPRSRRTSTQEHHSKVSKRAVSFQEGAVTVQRASMLSQESFEARACSSISDNSNRKAGTSRKRRSVLKRRPIVDAEGEAKIATALWGEEENATHGARPAYRNIQDIESDADDADIAAAVTEFTDYLGQWDVEAEMKKAASTT